MTLPAHTTADDVERLLKTLFSQIESLEVRPFERGRHRGFTVTLTVAGKRKQVVEALDRSNSLRGLELEHVSKTYTINDDVKKVGVRFKIQRTPTAREMAGWLGGWLVTGAIVVFVLLVVWSGMQSDGSGVQSCRANPASPDC